MAPHPPQVEGIDAIYGAPLHGLPVIECPPAVAALLATAHQRVYGWPAVAHLDDGEFVAGGPALHRDPSAPTDEMIDRLDAAARVSVLAGPGVVRVNAVPGLHALATAGSVGVLNTWGAKGVFDWRSRHHIATAGLQQRDFELSGLGESDLIVATGVDLDEAPERLWTLAPVLQLAPSMLAAVAERWRRPFTEISVPPLRAGLAFATQAGWAKHLAPLLPTRVTLNYGRALGSGGLIAADPGVSGYWVARTFSTTELGSVQVPATTVSGFAVACAIVSRLHRPLRPVLAVVDGPIDEISQELLEVAGSLGVGVPLEAWDPAGERLDAEAHLDRLLDRSRAAATSIVTIATDAAQIEQMEDVAGPVVAWGGLVTSR